jgi:F-type H+-transporting ATPase subunit delta
MRQIRLASRYATALFELAAEHHIQTEVFNDMQTLARVSASNRDFKLMLQSPVIKQDKKNAVLRALFGKEFHNTTLQYITIIVRKRREMILDEIALQYIEVYRAWKGIKVARLETAAELDEQQKKAFTDLLKEQLKAEITLETVVKPELIGGFLLSVDGQQFDSSILKKVKKLSKEFKVNVYKRKI